MFDLHDSHDNTVTFEDFNRKHPRLDYKIARLYHDTLQELRGYDDKLSLKIQSCGVSAIRLDCIDDDSFLGEHARYFPVRCRRRTDPECAALEIIDRVNQFFPIGEIAWDYHNVPDWRVRFWTLNPRGIPIGSNLEDYFINLKLSLEDLWRSLFGDNAQRKRPELKKCGGVFFFETQGENKTWNPHIHGLVLSPFFRWEDIMPLWEKILKKNNLSGNGCFIEETFVKSTRLNSDTGEIERIKSKCTREDQFLSAIREIVQYPIQLDKNGRHDQRLLAHVEHALFGKRRYIIKGDWYNKFKRPIHKAICEDCLGHFTKSSDEDYEALGGRAFKPDFFPETPAGLDRWRRLGYHYPKDGAKRRRAAELQAVYDFALSQNIPTKESLQ